MFELIAAGLLACNHCCGSNADKQVISPIINNNIVTPSPSSSRSSKISFIRELVDEARSIEGNAGSLGGYDSDSEIDVHVRIRTETHTHDQNHDLVTLAKQSGFRDLIEDKQ